MSGPYLIERPHGGFTKHYLNADGSQPWPVRPILHHFTGPDLGDPHDHPLAFWSHVIWGSYIEEVFRVAENGRWSSEMIHRQAHTSHFVEATDIHRIVALPEGQCLTVACFDGPMREWRHWRFDETGVASRPWHQPEYERLAA